MQKIFGLLDCIQHIVMGLKVTSGTAHILLQVQVGTVVHSQGKLQSNASVSYNGYYDFIQT